MNSAGCTVYTNDSSQMTKPNQVGPLWYLDSGAQTVSVGAQLQFPNGKCASLAALGKFSVVKPQVQFPFSAIPSMIPMLTNGWMQLGNDSQLGGDNTGTMNFDALITSTSSFNGQAFWTQLVKRSASYPLNATDTGGKYELDTEPVYSDIVTDIKPLGNNPNPRGIATFYDSPGVTQWTLWNVTILDNFQTHLEFQPTGGIAVPLGVVTWGWGATESGTNLIWSSTNAPVFQDSDQFPVWTAVTHGR